MKQTKIIAFYKAKNGKKILLALEEGTASCTFDGQCLNTNKESALNVYHLQTTMPR